MQERPSHHPLVFTKKERNGITAFVFLLLVSLFAPAILDYFFPTSLPEFSSEAEWTAALKLRETSKKNSQFPNKDYDEKGGKKNDVQLFPAKLEPFDPNKLSITAWIQLGVSEKTATGIRNYISKGGRFRKAADLKKIWGMPEEKLTQLMPYVRISDTGKKKTFTPLYPDHKPYTQKYNPQSIDINLADGAAWESLPGIGTKLAERIGIYRQKLGGFYSIDQVGELYGLTDSVFQTFKKRLVMEKYPVRTLSINSATIEELKAHPYIRFLLANAIIQYRNNHGNFKSVEELKNIQLIDEKLFKKLQPYLTSD